MNAEIRSAFVVSVQERSPNQYIRFPLGDLSMASAELRVFISSTFQDLQEERGYLMKHVFPEIRQRCRERGIEFTEIDLRWGLTHEEGTLGRIIRTCFEEIDKCRPFFIGIVGSRYGWTPKYLDIQKDPELLRKYPWIEQEVLDGTSLLELEFMHGVLGYAGQMSGAFFYAQTHKTLVPMRDSEREHLEMLTRRIHDSARPVRSFTDPQSLGELVRTDMLAAIDAHWPLDERNTRVAAERRGHEAFSAARRHAYIANPDNLKILNAHVAWNTPPLMIAAESGMGKSALLAFWSHAYMGKHPRAFVITHFIGTTPQGGAHGDVLRRILLEIKDRAGWDDEIPATQLALEQTLPLWLARLQEPLVLVIDALNQLDDRGRDLAWLPAFFPAHVRVVLSATSGTERDAARARRWGELELRPLSKEEREALTVRFLGEYHKGLSGEQINRIAGDPHSESPLFLRTVLEELRLFGYFQELDAHIDHYLATSDLPDLFQRVLERIERDFGPVIVRDIMTSIWASRNGLTESELMGVMALGRAECSRLLLSLDYHLMQRDGRRTFFHDFLRKAVEERYLATKSDQRAAHVRLGTYFASQPISERRAGEEPWQWEKAGELHKLKECICQIDLFNVLNTPDFQYELARYWRELATVYSPEEEYLEVITALRSSDSTTLKRDLMRDVGAFLTLIGKHESARSMLEKALNLTMEAEGGDSEAAAEVLDEMVNVMYALNKIAEALPYCKRAIEIRVQLFGESSAVTQQSRGQLGALLFSSGEYAEARQVLEDLLSTSSGGGAGETLHRARNSGNLAAVFFKSNDFEKASSLFQDATFLVERHYGHRYPEVAFHMGNHALACKMLGQLENALGLYQDALEILVESLGPDHEITANMQMNLGILGRLMNNYAMAEERLRIAMRVYKRLDPSSLRTSECILRLAFVLREQSKLHEAEALYVEGLPIFSTYVAEDDHQLRNFQSGYVKVLRQLGKHSEATQFENEHHPS